MHAASADRDFCLAPHRHLPPTDRINRRTWRTRSALRLYRRLEGFVDVGERVAFGRVVADARRGSVLDIGVGGGRTTAIVRAETRHYVGIDYTSEMIDICRAKFPDATFDIADARDLSRYASDTFELVQFSYNGIDAVDAAGRAQVLSEVFRVLRPGGAFFFSTFNRLGPGFETPGRTLRKIDFSAAPVTIARSLAGYAVGHAIGLWRRFTYRKYLAGAQDDALRLHGAHDYGILVHATTLPELRVDLARHGFAAPIDVIGCSGRAIEELSSTAEEYFHVVVRKPA